MEGSVLSFFTRTDYKETVGNSIFRCYPDIKGYRFTWQGPDMDQVGTYRISQEGRNLYLLLEYNYAREARYLLTISGSESGFITAFTITDRYGRERGFSR